MHTWFFFAYQPPVPTESLISSIFYSTGTLFRGSFCALVWSPWRWPARAPESRALETGKHGCRRMDGGRWMREWKFLCMFEKLNGHDKHINCSSFLSRSKILLSIPSLFSSSVEFLSSSFSSSSPLSLSWTHRFYTTLRQPLPSTDWSTSGSCATAV